MNTNAYYNGFVSRCMERGLTKQAAGALYKEAGLLDDLKSGGGRLLDGMKTVRNMASEHRKALKLGLLGAGAGMVHGIVHPEKDKRKRLRRALALAAVGGAIGGAGGYGLERLLAGNGAGAGGFGRGVADRLLGGDA